MATKPGRVAANNKELPSISHISLSSGSLVSDFDFCYTICRFRTQTSKLPPTLVIFVFYPEATCTEVFFIMTFLKILQNSQKNTSK